MASINDLITETFNGQNPASTTVANSRAIGGTTLVCQSLVGWPTNTAVHFATYQKDSTGAKVAGSQVDWKGVVSGSSINTLTRRGGAADSGNGIGDIIEMMPTYSWGYDLAKGVEVLHNADGTWKSGAALAVPAIADFTNANHTHSGVTSGGLLPNGIYSTNRNNNGSNIAETSAKLQTGWVNGTPGSSSIITISTTFPVAYTNVPIVVAAFGGDTAGTTTTLGAGGSNVNNASAEAISLTTTGCTIRISTLSAAAWSGVNTVYAQWIAIGT